MTTQTPFYLTARMVAEKALPLLLAGKLGRQLHQTLGCWYRHPEDGSPCVIGAALPDDVTARCQTYGATFSPDVDELLDGFILSSPDRSTLRRLQKLHDNNAIDDLRTALERILAEHTEGEPT